MEQKENRRKTVFFIADITLMVTVFLFVHYNIERGAVLLGVIEVTGGLVFLGLAALVFFKGRFLKHASWILVIITAGFALGAVLLFNLYITNLVWMLVPYFLSMFLLGFRSGTAVSLIFIAGIIFALIVRFGMGADAIPFINRLSIIAANVFAFLFAAYYEKARSDNERELLVKNREIEIMSHHDGLTGLFNRRFFDLALNKEFHRAKREREPLALIILDIDFFKNYNDTFGHLQGDACLGEVAEVINSSITRTTDTATRYGGEEFAVLLPNTNDKGAIIVAQRIRQMMAGKAIPHPLSGISEFITLSLGVAVLSQEEDKEPTDLIRRADRALYASKSGGRDRITCA